MPCACTLRRLPRTRVSCRFSRALHTRVCRKAATSGRALIVNLNLGSCWPVTTCPSTRCCLMPLGSARPACALTPNSTCLRIGTSGCRCSELGKWFMCPGCRHGIGLRRPPRRPRPKTQRSANRPRKALRMATSPTGVCGASGGMRRRTTGGWSSLLLPAVHETRRPLWASACK